MKNRKVEMVSETEAVIDLIDGNMMDVAVEIMSGILNIIKICKQEKRDGADMKFKLNGAKIKIRIEL